MRLVVLVVSVILLAGCSDSAPEAIKAEDADEVARSAMENFAQDIATDDGGALTKITGSFDMEADPEAEFGFGDASVDFTLEWGAADTSMVQFTVASGGFSFEAAAYCSPERGVLVFGADTVESRPEQGSCLEEFGEVGEVASLAAFDEMTLVSTQASGGGVLAVFEDDNGTYTIHVDAQERITRMAMETDEGDGVMELSYGARRIIPMPEADARMPLQVYGFGYFDGSAYQWSAGAGNATAPYGDIEIRVMDGPLTVASFTPSPGSQQAGGFTLDFQDDGDGRFGGGDAFSLSSPAWANSGDYDVEVYDAWADAPVGENAVPGMGAWAIVAALGVCMLLRRQ